MECQSRIEDKKEERRRKRCPGCREHLRMGSLHPRKFQSAGTRWKRKRRLGKGAGEGGGWVGLPVSRSRILARICWRGKAGGGYTHTCEHQAKPPNTCGTLPSDLPSPDLCKTHLPSSPSVPVPPNWTQLWLPICCQCPILSQTTPMFFLFPRPTGGRDHLPSSRGV